MHQNPSSGRIRRLVADLARPETRGDALARVRRRVGAELRRLAGRSPARKAADGRGAPDAAGKRPDWYLGEWGRLAKTVLGIRPPDDAPDAARATEILKLAARQRAEAMLGQAIARGEPLEGAVAVAASELADALEHATAWSIAEGAGRLPGGANASAIGHTVLHHRRRQFDRAWRVAQAVDDGVLATHIPREAVDAAFGAGTDEARRRALAIGEPSDAMTPAVLVDLAGRFLAMREPARAADLVAELRRRPTAAGDLDERRRYALSLIERWLERRPVNVPPGAVTVGVVDYGTPDHVLTSGNLGDYIQTLSLLGNLVRLDGVRFTGEDGLGETAAELADRVRPELRAAGPGGAVHLVPVDRDFSSDAEIPERTWTIAFGWHMHPLYDLRYDFPYHPNIRPIFLSFHVNRLDMLTDEALAYLRAHAPIGCRDWNTVYLLLSADIDAFFSGCLTLTVDALFPRREDAYAGNGAVGVIDLPPHAAGKNVPNVRLFSHQSDRYRYMNAARGVRAATEALREYQRDLERAVTGRLHAFLPLTSLGVPVEFRSGSPGDYRFAGLTDLTADDPRLDEIRSGIRDLVAAVFARVLAGAPDDEVYAHWRTLTTDRVAEARRRFHAPVADPPTTVDVGEAVATSRAASRRFGPHDGVDPEEVTDLVLAYDRNLTLPAAVLLESVVTNASGPLRVWILARGLSDEYQGWLAGAFPTLPITFLPCDLVTYGPAGRPRRLPARITISTMDRLILPALLDDVERVVYLDVDTLMLGDVSELARTDLEGRPVAAVDSNVTEPSEWQRAGRHLPEPVATELRRRNARLHGFAGTALNAGVLVMDLDRMRADDFATRYLGWAEAYGSHDQDTMLAYIGPDRARLDPRWNAMPVIRDVEAPYLIHWASFGKPWDPNLTFEQPLWHEYAGRLRARAGDPPGWPA